MAQKKIVTTNLSAIDEIKKVWGEGEKSWQLASKITTKIEDLKQDLSDAIADLENQLSIINSVKEKGIKKVVEVQNQLKALGLDPNKEVGSWKTTFEQYDNTASILRDRVKNSVASIRKI
jgi:hypothetical protein